MSHPESAAGRSVRAAPSRARRRRGLRPRRARRSAGPCSPASCCSATTSMWPGYGFRLFGAEMFRRDGTDSGMESLPVRRPAVHRRPARRHLLSDRVAPLGPAGRHRDEPRLLRAHRARGRDHVRVAPGAARRAGRARWSAAWRTSSSGIVASLVRPGPRRQAVRLRAGAAGAARAAPGHPRPPALGLWPAGAHGGALHAEPALPDDVLPAGRGRGSGRSTSSSSIPERPAGLRWPRGARRSAFGAVLLGLAIAAIQVLPFLALHPVLAARRRRTERRLGLRHPRSRCRPRSL